MAGILGLAINTLLMSKGKGLKRRLEYADDVHRDDRGRA